MEYFQYPIDTRVLLRKKASIKKKLLQNIGKSIQKKIAVLGGSTTNEIVDQLEIFLLQYGIEAEFYQSEYGQYWQDAMFGNQKLDEFCPDIIYIHTNWRNIEQFPTIANTTDEIEEIFIAEYKRFEAMWQVLRAKFHCPIIQNNFDRPDYRLMGNRDVWDMHGRSNYISRLNQKFYEYAQMHEDFYINDLDYLSSDFGLTAWGNATYWYMYKYAMCLEAIPLLANSVANIIKSLFGQNRKVLVLDLDGTLWGGIVGDDGVEGIAVGPEMPNGQVYAGFQSYCKNLQDIGVVLAVDSKNDEKNALAGLSHPNSVLHSDDFVSIKANWETKDQNLREIASELALGVESFVFADDNPAERAIVVSQIPGVAVPNMEGAENYIKILDHSGYFEVTTLSSEDLHKTELYHAKAQATRAESLFADYGEYLKSLKMTASVRSFESMYIKRIAQLTNKSNQFNLTTLRCTEDDIRAMAVDKNYVCLYGKLADRFGDNGVVTVAVGELKEEILHIRLWLMSCRVLKRGMEDVMMNRFVSVAVKQGVKNIIGYYYPTPKNSMVRDFYSDMGFVLSSVDENGNSKWLLKATEYQMKKTYIKVIED